MLRNSQQKYEARLLPACGSEASPSRQQRQSKSWVFGGIDAVSSTMHKLTSNGCGSCHGKTTATNERKMKWPTVVAKKSGRAIFVVCTGAGCTRRSQGTSPLVVQCRPVDPHACTCSPRCCLFGQSCASDGRHMCCPSSGVVVKTQTSTA